MTEKNRILLVTRNLPPLVGGMERLNWHMIQELSVNKSVSVVGPKVSKPLSPETDHYCAVSLSPVSRYLIFAMWHSVRLARMWKPNVVLAGSGLTAPIAWVAARLSSARSVTYLHGLDIAVDSRLYRHLWLPFIRRMDRVVVNSRATADLAIQAGIKKEKIGIVHPGVDLPEANISNNDNEFYRKYDLSTAPILLSVGRLTERKGLRQFVKFALPAIVKKHPDVQLVIVGSEAENALAAQSQSKESIHAIAAEVGVAQNIKFIGTITDYKLLGKAFNAASVHVFPVRELPNDPEGFGMVAVEAAAHGLPTVAFASGGVVDAVEDGKSGWLVQSGNYSKFSEKVIHCIATSKHKTWRESCQKFASGKAWPAFRLQLERELEVTMT